MSKIVFLGTGGTIAGTACSPLDSADYQAAQLGIAQLLQAVPLLSEVLCGYDIAQEQIVQLDSKDMDFQHLVTIAQAAATHLLRQEVAGLVITHGTDTLEETAYFLSRTLSQDALAQKPVVLTCAMRPANALLADGPQNMLDAAAVAIAPGAKGVLVVCAGRIHAATHVEKVHPYRLDAFESGDAGALGYVEKGVVRVPRGWPALLSAESPVLLDKVATAAAAGTLPRVEIVMSHVSATGGVVRALCAGTLAKEDTPVQGLVVAGTGNGTIHADLEAALRQAQQQGIRIVRTTRCMAGAVVPATISHDAFPHSHGLPPVKARIALMLELLG